MKSLKFKALLCISLLYSGSVFSLGVVGCPQPELEISSEVKKLSAHNCEEINTLNKCRERVVDPNALRNKITARLKNVEENKDLLVRRMNENRKISTSNLFIKTGRDKYTYLFDHIAKIDPDVDQDKLKKEVVNNYLEFAEKNDCIPKIKSGAVWRICPAALKVEGNTTKAKSEMQRLLKLPENIEKRNKCLSHVRGDEGIERLQFCSKTPNVSARKAAYRIQSPCAGNFIQNFKDNKWEIPEFGELLKSGKLDGDLLKCLKHRIANGGKIKTISIRSSSNSLNNTGSAATKFCKKGFKALSEARSQYAKEDLVPKLLEAAGLENPQLGDELFSISSSGSNGDGTSGPCPYAYKDGKESLKKEFYKGGEKRGEIDKGKYLKVSISFEEKRTELHNQKYYVRARHGCRRITFQCPPRKVVSPKSTSK